MLKKIFSKIIVRLLINVHNICYRYIGYFSIIAEGGIHPKHRLTNYHSFFVENISSNDKVLDVGCGNGFLTYEVAEKAKKVVAVDVNKKNIEHAKKFFKRDNIEYIHKDATTLNFDRKFNVAILSNVLEHIEDRHSFLLKISQLADKILIRVPMINRDWLTYYKKESGCKYFLDPAHKIEYTMESFTKELAEAGLKIDSASIQFGEIWAVVRKSQ